MKTINLFEANPQVELKKFAGGECHVRLTEDYTGIDAVTINTRLNSSDDIMNFCLAVDALRHMHVRHIEAFIPYIPYARQDRVMSSGEPLSIKVFANMLNALRLDRVTVFDAHSDVSTALINSCMNIHNHDMVNNFVSRLGLADFRLVSPDLGAYKKLDRLAQAIVYKGEIITGIKIRDLSTGNILRSDVNCEDLAGKSCLVVDDICDGGRTFLELASTLKSRNAGDIHLVVSHGIFSYNALERLREAGYKHVCSSDSIGDRNEDEFYKQYKLF